MTDRIYTREETNQIYELMHSEPVLFSWDTVTCNAFGEDKKGVAGKRWRVMMSSTPIMMAVLICLFMALVGSDQLDMLTIYVFIGIISVSIMMSLMIRYVSFEDDHCRFELTQFGIICRYKQKLSEGTINTLKILGWIAVIICILAFFIVGPLAFAGAGVFGFSVMKFRNFQVNERIYHSEFFDKMICYSFKNTNMIRLISYPYGSESSLVFNEEDRETILNQLKKTIHHFEVYEVNNYKESDNHPSLLEAVQARHVLLKEMRAKGIDI